MKIRFKKIITIILLWSISQSVSAQFLGEDSIYFSADINSGTFFGSDININYINKNDYTFKLGFSANIRASKSTPSDYKSGITDILLLGLTSPHDIVLNYQCYIGKIYYF